VSVNDTKITSQALQKVGGRNGCKGESSDDCQKTCRDFADVTRYGSSFQTRAAATGKAQSPTVDNHELYDRRSCSF